MNLDKNRPFGTIASLDPNQKTFYTQDGIDYDKKGKPVDKNQVRTYHQSIVDAAQKRADTAKEVAEATQAEADAAAAAAEELLSDPEAPKTVAELTAALKELNIDIPANSLKADLEQLWVFSQSQ